MARVTVRVIGQDRIRDRLRELVTGMRSGAAESSEEMAERVQSLAKDYVPVDTGRLRDSIRVNQVGRAKFTVGPGDEVEYAEFVEYGTSVSPAQPYMRPALELARREFGRRVARTVRAEIR